MKKLSTILLVTLFGLGIWSCSSEANTETETDITVTDSTEIETSVDSVIVIFDTITIETPILDSVVENNIPKISALYLSYKNHLSVPTAIKEESDIKSILATRDSLIALMQYGPLEEYYYGELESNFDKQKMLGEEFESLGINVVYVEGMYAGLSEAPLLMDKINEVATDSYKYYLSFMQAYSNSLGTEYTYDNLKPEIQMIKHGEALYNEFPESEYIPLIKDKYEQAIMVMTDIHKVGEYSFIVGGMITDPYPTMTNGEYYTKFAKDYPKSKFAPVLKAISGNFSHIADEPSEVYVILIEWQPTITKAGKKALEYIMTGKDVPHYFALKTTEGEKYAIAYRFFSERTKAEASLEKAQVISPKAKIIRVDAVKMTVLPDIKPEMAEADSIKTGE